MIHPATIAAVRTIYDSKGQDVGMTQRLIAAFMTENMPTHAKMCEWWLAHEDRYTPAAYTHVLPSTTPGIVPRTQANAWKFDNKCAMSLDYVFDKNDKGEHLSVQFRHAGPHEEMQALINGLVNEGASFEGWNK